MFRRRPPPYLPPAPHAVRPLQIDALFALFCFLTLWASVAVGGLLRYVAYLVPIVGLAAAFAIGRLHLPEVFRPFLALFVGGLAFAPLASGWGWQDLYLMLVGIMPFCLGYRPRLTWWQVFAGFLVGSIVSIAIAQVTGTGGWSQGVKFDPLMSESSFESQFGLVFGMIALWAALNRRWGLFLLALLAAVLALKRIGVIATVVCGLVCLLPRPLTDRLLRPWFMVPLNLALLALEVTYGFGGFDRLISDITNLSSNQFSMGRRVLWHWPAHEIVEDLPALAVLGNGAGHAYALLTEKTGFMGKYLIHSDLMKVLVEYGGLVWIAFFWMAYASRSFVTRMFWLYFNVLMLTDNPVIYGYLIFALGLCTLCARRDAGDTDGSMLTLYLRSARPPSVLTPSPVTPPHSASARRPARGQA